jgi:hypothetical protein
MAPGAFFKPYRSKAKERLCKTIKRRPLESENAVSLGYREIRLNSRIKEGRLRAVKLDGRVKVPRSELARYLAQATPVQAAS